MTEEQEASIRELFVDESTASIVDAYVNLMKMYEVTLLNLAMAQSLKETYRNERDRLLKSGN